MPVASSDFFFFNNVKRAYGGAKLNKAEGGKNRKESEGRRSRIAGHRQPKQEQICLCLLGQRGKINLMERVIKHFFFHHGPAQLHIQLFCFTF